MRQVPMLIVAIMIGLYTTMPSASAIVMSHVPQLDGVYEVANCDGGEVDDTFTDSSGRIMIVPASNGATGSFLLDFGDASSAVPADNATWEDAAEFDFAAGDTMPGVTVSGISSFYISEVDSEPSFRCVTFNSTGSDKMSVAFAGSDSGVWPYSESSLATQYVKIRDVSLQSVGMRIAQVDYNVVTPDGLSSGTITSNRGSVAGYLMDDESIVTLNVTVEFTEPVYALNDVTDPQLNVEWTYHNNLTTYVDATTVAEEDSLRVLSAPTTAAMASSFTFTIDFGEVAGIVRTSFTEDEDFMAFVPRPMWSSFEQWEVVINRYGCTLPDAINGTYDEQATINDGSCIFPSVVIVEGEPTSTEVVNRDGNVVVDVSLPANGLETAGATALTARERSFDDANLQPPSTDTTIASSIVQIVAQTGAGDISGRVNLDKPARVQLKVNGPVNTRAEVLEVQYKQEDTDPWQKLPGGVFNAATGMMQFETDHFTIFTVMKRPRPIEPDLGGGCDNRCSGHGNCVGQGQCSCWANWEGPDCSLRTCAFGNAWGVDHTSDGHYYSECSNRGLCNRETGECDCFDGYTGAACDRNECPNDCSGHGKCRLVSELQDGLASTFLGWDGEKVQACECDGGFIGADCSERLCPKGDDPMTLCNPAPGDQVQRLTFEFAETTYLLDTNTDEIGLRFRDSYGEVWSLQRAGNLWITTSAARSGGDQLTQALESLPNHAVPDVTVSPQTALSGASKVVYDVAFTSPLNSGNPVELMCPDVSGCTHAGCQPVFKQISASGISSGSDTEVSSVATINSADSVVVPPNAAANGEYDLEVTVTFTLNADSQWSYAVSSINSGGSPVTDSSFLGFRGFVQDDEEFNLAHGLLVSFDVDAFGTTTPGTYSLTLRYNIGHCSVTTQTSAPAKSEDIECSGRGACNRGTGECECFDGFYGLTCSKSTILI